MLNYQRVGVSKTNNQRNIMNSGTTSMTIPECLQQIKICTNCNLQTTVVGKPLAFQLGKPKIQWFFIIFSITTIPSPNIRYLLDPLVQSWIDSFGGPIFGQFSHHWSMRLYQTCSPHPKSQMYIYISHIRYNRDIGMYQKLDIYCRCNYDNGIYQIPQQLDVSIYSQNSPSFIMF